MSRKKKSFSQKKTEMIADKKIAIAINQLKIWAISNHQHPKRTSFHAAALLYRGRILMNPNKSGLLAAVNSKYSCAERMLLWLCEKSTRCWESYERQCVKEL
jgi:hypothetical protein